MGQLNNENGQTTMMLIIIATGIIVLFQSAMSMQVYNQRKIKSRLLTKQNMNVFLSNIETQLTNDEVWKKSIEDNKSSFECLFKATCDPQAIEKNIVLKDLEGNIISDGKKYGLDINGDTCLADKPHCIYILEVKWKVLCDDKVTCINPRVKLTPYLVSKNDSSQRQLAVINIEGMVENKGASRDFQGVASP